MSQIMAWKGNTWQEKETLDTSVHRKVLCIVVGRLKKRIASDF